MKVKDRVTCETCRHATFERNDKDNVRRALPGTCGYKFDATRAEKAIARNLPVCCRLSYQVVCIAIWLDTDASECVGYDKTCV